MNHDLLLADASGTLAALQAANGKLLAQLEQTTALLEESTAARHKAIALLEDMEARNGELRDRLDAMTELVCGALALAGLDRAKVVAWLAWVVMVGWVQEGGD